MTDKFARITSADLKRWRRELGDLTQEQFHALPEVAEITTLASIRNWERDAYIGSRSAQLTLRVLRGVVAEKLEARQGS